jgi:hypothetical protein
MQEFLDSLTVNQLVLLKHAVKGEIIKRSKPKDFRIHITNIKDMTDDYDDTRDSIIDAMGNVRSKKIFVNVDNREAKITFENSQLARDAAPLLRKVFDEVKIY